MHIPDNTDVSPKVRSTVAQAGEILFTRNKSSADRGATHTCTSLIDGRAIASAVGDQVGTNTRNGLSSKLIRQQRIVSICERIDPVDPARMSVVGSRD